jgi:hypothetical protein
MTKKLTTEQFVENAKLAHGITYDYSCANYINNKTKLTIVCPIHGPFEQLPRDHIDGSGCHICGYEQRTPRSAMSFEQFINKAKSVHGNHYDYSKTNYINFNEKIVVICPTHGEFTVRANSHLQGTKCARCSRYSKGETAIRNFLIDHDLSFSEQYRNATCKLGKTLPFDFYLPDYNLLIEFQGRHHFDFIKRFHKTQEGFEHQKLRDTTKKQWAVDNNINLLEISYQDTKDIDNILIAYLGL